VLHAESNVQFGEGGALTLRTASLEPDQGSAYLGRKMTSSSLPAPAEYFWFEAAHRHLLLVKVVEHMREQIIALGGVRSASSA
jgi:uncharacterized FAD-dependent dehydrogenase